MEFSKFISLRMLVLLFLIPTCLPSTTPTTTNLVAAPIIKNPRKSSNLNEFTIECDDDLQLTLSSTDIVVIKCRNSTNNWQDKLNNCGLFEIGDVKSVIFDSCKPIGADTRKIRKFLKIAGVKELKYENLQGKRLLAKDLAAFPRLNVLTLSNNQLTDVSPKLLQCSPNLEKLVFSNTHTRIPQGFFLHAKSLKHLEMNDNEFIELKPGIFDGLNQLKSLSLRKNRIDFIEPKIFTNLTNLTSLDLSFNDLNVLPTDAFEGLINLEVVDLNFNKFTSLPKNLLKDNVRLKIFSMNYNEANLTELPERLFDDLTDLRILTLARCGLLQLPDDLLVDAVALNELNLENNRLRNLTENFLKNSKDLEAFSARGNDLSELPDYLFSNNEKLKRLDLSRNRLQSINEMTLVGLSALEELNLESNDLTDIHVRAFDSLTELKILRLANNELTLQTGLSDFFGALSPFEKCIDKLQIIDLAHNNVSEIFSDWMLLAFNLRELDLSFNQFESLQSEDLQIPSNNLRINLSNNLINTVYLDTMDSIILKNPNASSRNLTLLLNDNPIECDCDLYSLLRYANYALDANPAAAHATNSKFINVELGDTRCSDNPNELANDYEGKIKDLKADELKCRYYYATSDARLVVDDNDNKDRDNLCSRNGAGGICDCWRRPQDNSLLVDCSRKNLTKPPVDVQLGLGDAKICVELDLSYNELTIAPTLNGEGYDRICRLNLAGNRIEELKMENLLSKDLETINLESNKLKNISDEILSHLQSNASKSLRLRDNPWDCSCTSKNLLNLFKSSTIEIADREEIRCAGSDIPLNKLTLSILCFKEYKVTLLILANVCIFILLFGLIAVLRLRYGRCVKFDEIPVSNADSEKNNNNNDNKDDGAANANRSRGF